MILGIGHDMVDIRRIAVTLERFGDRFLTRIFTPQEQARARRHPAQMAASLAKRFAAKEACAKALGTGFRQGVFWRDIGVISLPSGAPCLMLQGGAAQQLAALLPPDLRGVKDTDPAKLPPPWTAKLHVSLTDDYPWASANVVIEALELKGAM
jgi:holo-[acyl-carrier protein] synthase